LGKVRVTVCGNECCRRHTVWIEGRLVYPTGMAVEPPNDDLPDEIKRDYAEAAAVGERSPRSACMLLRFCLECLCNKCGAKKGSLADKIDDLVKERGLSAGVAKAAHALRVVSGNAVHPLELDLTTAKGEALTLFRLMNRIAYDLITHPKEVDALLKLLPAKEQENIQKRVKKTSIRHQEADGQNP